MANKFDQLKLKNGSTKRIERLKRMFTSINKGEIEGVKKLLLNESYKKYSIVAISKEVGFNSRASFYKNFKERVGISPSDYINQN